MGPSWLHSRLCPPLQLLSRLHHTRWSASDLSGPARASPPAGCSKTSQQPFPGYVVNGAPKWQWPALCVALAASPSGQFDYNCTASMNHVQRVCACQEMPPQPSPSPQLAVQQVDGAAAGGQLSDVQAGAAAAGAGNVAAGAARQGGVETGTAGGAQGAAEAASQQQQSQQVQQQGVGGAGGAAALPSNTAGVQAVGARPQGVGGAAAEQSGAGAAAEGEAQEDEGEEPEGPLPLPVQQVGAGGAQGKA